MADSPSSAASGSPAASPAAPIGVQPNPASESGFSESQLRELARWHIEAGRLSPEKAVEMLAVDGVDAKPEEFRRGELVPGEPLTAPGFAPVPGDKFELPQLGDASSPLDQVTKADGEIRQWLGAAQLPLGIGNFLAKEAGAQFDRLHAMDAPQRGAWAAEQELIVRRTWGDAADAKLAAARDLVRQVDAQHPGLLDFLRSSGLADSATLTVFLGDHAERLAQHRSRR